MALPDSRSERKTNASSTSTASRASDTSPARPPLSPGRDGGRRRFPGKSGSAHRCISVSWPGCIPGEPARPETVKFRQAYFPSVLYPIIDNIPAIFVDPAFFRNFTFCFAPLCCFSFCHTQFLPSFSDHDDFGRQRAPASCSDAGARCSFPGRFCGHGRILI